MNRGGIFNTSKEPRWLIEKKAAWRNAHGGKENRDFGETDNDRLPIRVR